MIRDIPRAAFAAGLVWNVGACSGAPAGSPVLRTDSAGVEIVTHSGSDVKLDWTFDVAFRLGGKEGGEESFFEVGSAMLGVDGAHRIHVLDHGARRVLVFDAEGRHLRTLGGEGGGPGEMRFPIGLTVESDGAVAVFDISKGGFVRFGPDGEILPETRAMIGYTGGVMRHVGNALVIPVSTFDPDLGTNRDELLAIVDGDTSSVVRLERPAGGTLKFESCGMQIMGVAPIFAPTLRWAAIGADVAATVAVGYEITVYRGGRPARIIRRSVAPVPATAEMAAARVGKGMQVATPGGVRTCDPQEEAEQRGLADAIPVIGGIAEGPDGTLWVRREGAPGSPQPIDVFDAEGTYLGSLPDGSPFPAAVLGHRLIAIEKDDLDVERLVIYDLTRGGRVRG